MNIIRIEYAFVKYRSTYPGGPAAFLADVTQQTYILKHAIYVLQTLLADGVVVSWYSYLCLFFGFNWCLLELLCLSRLPGFRFIAVMLFGDPSGLSSYQAYCGAVSQVRTRSGSRSRAYWRCFEVTGVIGLYCASQSGSSSENVFAQVLAPWVTAFFALTIATNLLSSGKCFYVCGMLKPWVCLGLLVYRIWLIESNTSTARTTKSTMIPLMHVLMDTAVLYSVVLFIALICFVCSNNGEVVMLDMVITL